MAGSNAKTFSSTVTVHSTIIMGQDFYAISRISGSALEIVTKSAQGDTSDKTDALNQRSTMGWKMTFATSRLNENFAVRVEHAVSS